MTPSVRREAAEVFVNDHRLRIQRACRIVGLSRTAFYRVPKPKAERDAAVIAILQAMVTRRPRWGFWKCYDRMRIEGHPWNHKPAKKIEDGLFDSPILGTVLNLRDHGCVRIPECFCTELQWPFRSIVAESRVGAEVCKELEEAALVARCVRSRRGNRK